MLGQIIFLLVLFPAVILHEIAHGYSALWLGDPTARDAGRLTLNPIRHIDLIGTILLPVILALSGAPVFGWAKPVPVNLNRMRDPQLGMWVTAVAGPLSNLAQILAAAGLYRLMAWTGVVPQWPALVLILYARVNMLLLVFNMLPIPPLDGSKVLAAVMPPAMARAYLGIQMFGFIAIFLLLRAGFLGRLITPAFTFVDYLMPW